MCRFLVTLGIWLSLVLSAQGHSVEILVTRTNLNQNGYLFAVSTGETRGGVEFHVTITAKAREIPSDSTAGLAVVSHTEDSASIDPLAPAKAVALRKNKQVWKAEFTLSRKLLKKSGLCFVFTEVAHATVDGKVISMPSADFYEIRLQDFLP
jgi:hypothetical protein